MWRLAWYNILIYQNYIKNFIEITTPCGIYLGRQLSFNNDGVVGEFLGISYGLPPTWGSRFSEPLKYHCFPGTKFVADQIAKACPQISMFDVEQVEEEIIKPDDISEDCLQLNIWTPINKKTIEKGKFPVIVFIHGGDFLEGSGSLDKYNGSVLAVKTKSVVVNINFRLGALGFSRFPYGNYIPGNMGLKDQQLALEWIYKYIEYFGGDQTKLTLFGEGSGAASISAQLMAHKSKNYIQRAIMFSGHMANPRYFKSSEILSNNTVFLSKLARCGTGPYQRVLHCLQSYNAFQIVRFTQYVLREFRKYGIGSPFGIAYYDDSFFGTRIPDTFFNIAFNSRNFNPNASILLGHIKNEGSLYLLKNYYKTIYEYNKTTEKYDLFINNSIYKKIFDDIGMKLKFSENKTNDLRTSYRDRNKYKNSQIKTTYDEKLNQFFGDILTNCDIRRFMQKLLEANISTPYVAELSERGSPKFYPAWIGVTRKDLIEFSFGYPFRNSSIYNTTNIDLTKNISLSFMMMLRNFADTGKFNSSWTLSNETFVKERILDKNIFKNNFTISETPILTNSCRIFYYEK